MCAATRRRTTTRLAGKASPYHGGVTLYEVSGKLDTEEGQAGSSTLRRSGRVKQEPVEPAQDSTQIRVAPKTRAASSKRVKAEAPDSDTVETSSSPKKRKLTSKPKPKLNNPHPAPANWADTYAAIKDMRSRIVAPVDTMGCDQAQYGEQDPKNQRFATLVSLMLSSQTKDEVTDAAITQLRAALGGSISVRGVMEAEDATISAAIAKVGFWRRKTQYIKQTARRLYEEFDGEVPKTAEELCALPGVGPKMAYLALQVAWNLNVGIGVDVHVHRITNRLGWHIRPTRNPEETRLNLESWLPKELHSEINHLLVGFGQTVCLPVGPKCGECTLGSGGHCPSAQTARKKGSKTSSSSKGDTGPEIEMQVEIPLDMDEVGEVIE